MKIGFWKDVGGGSARFEDDQQGQGIFARRFEAATFDNGVLEGRWIRDAPIEGIQIVTKE